MRAVEATGEYYEYITYMRGQDYPVKSEGRIRDTLAAAAGRQFVEANPIGSEAWRVDRYSVFGECALNRKLWVRCVDKALRTLQRPVVRRPGVGGMKVFKGSAWFTVTMPCMLHVLSFVRNNPWYMRRFRNTYCPDESFFHTIVLNGPYRNVVANDDLTFIDWSESRRARGSPRVLTGDDALELHRGRDLFARKFDASRDSAVLDALDRFAAADVR